MSKRFGHCTQCDAPVFDGQMRPTDDALRVDLAMRDGSTASVTFCRGCVAQLDLTTVHHILLEAWREQVLDASNRTPQAQVRVEAWLRTMHDNPPLGVVGQRAWADLL